MPETPAADTPAPAAAAPAPAAAAPAPAATPDKPAATPAAAAAAPASSDATPEPKGAWPDDWVTRMSKGDEKRAKDFSRYASPEAVADAYTSLRRRLDSGEFRAVLPKDPKPDELKAWRKDNGIPDKPEGYDLAGIQVPEELRDNVGDLLNRLHARNASPDVVREVVQARLDDIKSYEAAEAEADNQDRERALDALNQEYGAGFRRNIGLIQGTIISKLPESVRDGFLNARLADGTALFNNVDFVRGMVAMARELNPAGIVAPGGDGDITRGLMEEYQAIEKRMVEDRGGYNKDEAMQSRYREVVDAMIKHGLMDQNGNLIGRKAA